MQPADPNLNNRFFALNLAIMQPGTIAPVNLYIKVGKPPRFTLYKRANAELTEQVRDRLMAHGLTDLYVRNEDERAYWQYVEQNITTLIKDDLLPHDEVCELVYRSSSRVMVSVFNDPRSGTNMRRAQDVVEATVLSILKDPDALWHMSDVAARDYQTYTHSVNVCMFLVAAATHVLDIRDAAMLRRIGIGAMFHDIGMSQIPDETTSKPPARLSREEMNALRRHPVIGYEMARSYGKLSESAGAIIRSHHEHLDGTGYPDGLSGHEISKLVRLMTIVNTYDTLTTGRPHTPAKTPFQALETMVKGMPGQLDAELLKAFVQFLGPMQYRENLRSRLGGVTARLRKGARRRP